MTKIFLTIPGKPIAKTRPRFRKDGRTYDNQKKEKEHYRFIIQQRMSQARILSPLKGAISVEAIFYTPIPKSWPQKRRKEVFGTPNTRKPDCDNYLKFLLDSMNNLVFIDDAQVTRIQIFKFYSVDPRTEAIVYPLKGNLNE